MSKFFCIPWFFQILEVLLHLQKLCEHNWPRTVFLNQFFWVWSFLSKRRSLVFGWDHLGLGISSSTGELCGYVALWCGGREWGWVCRFHPNWVFGLWSHMDPGSTWGNTPSCLLERHCSFLRALERRLLPCAPWSPNLEPRFLLTSCRSAAAVSSLQSRMKLVCLSTRQLYSSRMALKALRTSPPEGPRSPPGRSTSPPEGWVSPLGGST